MFDVTLNVLSSPAPTKVNSIVPSVDKVKYSSAAACVTFMRLIDPNPLPVTPTIPPRVDADGLAAAVRVTVPLFKPEDGVTVSQVRLLLTDQLVFDVTLNVLFSPTATKFSADSDKLKVAATPACVIAMVCGVNPVPLTVIVAVRGNADGLASAVTVIVPVFVPDDAERVSHVAVPLLTVQFVLDVTVNELFPPAARKLSVAVDTVNDSNLACVTSTVREMPSPVTVISVGDTVRKSGTPACFTSMT